MEETFDQGCQIVYFQNKSPNLDKFLECLAMTDLGKCHFVHFIHLMAIGYILRPFGYIFPFWYVVPRKIWQPCLRQGRCVVVHRRRRFCQSGKKTEAVFKKKKTIVEILIYGFVDLF
jgi:hypothetical protein